MNSQLYHIVSIILDSCSFYLAKLFAGPGGDARGASDVLAQDTVTAVGNPCEKNVEN